MPEADSAAEFTKEEEAALERADKEWKEELGPDIEDWQDQSGKQKTLEGKEADPALLKQNDASEDKEKMFAILELLGFIRYEEKFGPRYKKTIDDLVIARDFSEKYPTGRFWILTTTPELYGEDVTKEGFLKEEAIKKIDIIRQFYDLRDSDDPIPQKIIIGEVVGVSESGKAVHIAFTETVDGEPKKVFYGKGAVKTNSEGKYFIEEIVKNGKYIPAGFSKASKRNNQPAKMDIPRHIVLPFYDEELKNAPVVKGSSNNRSVAERETAQDYSHSKKEAEKEALGFDQQPTPPIADEFKDRLSVDMCWAIHEAAEAIDKEVVQRWQDRISSVAEIDFGKIAEAVEKVAVTLFISLRSTRQ